MEMHFKNWLELNSGFDLVSADVRTSPKGFNAMPDYHSIGSDQLPPTKQTKKLGLKKPSFAKFLKK